jgi:hypothetical protein
MYWSNVKNDIVNIVHSLPKVGKNWTKNFKCLMFIEMEINPLRS